MNFNLYKGGAYVFLGADDAGKCSITTCYIGCLINSTHPLGSVFLIYRVLYSTLCETRRIVCARIDLCVLLVLCLVGLKWKVSHARFLWTGAVRA